MERENDDNQRKSTMFSKHLGCFLCITFSRYIGYRGAFSGA